MGRQIIRPLSSLVNWFASSVLVRVLQRLKLDWLDEDAPLESRDVPESFRVTVRTGRLVRHVTNENAGDLPRILLREFAVDFRVALARIADENELPVRELFQQRFNHAELVFHGIGKQAEETPVLPAKRLQVKRAGGKTIRR